MVIVVVDSLLIVPGSAVVAVVVTGVEIVGVLVYIVVVESVVTVVGVGVDSGVVSGVGAVGVLV